VIMGLVETRHALSLPKFPTPERAKTPGTIIGNPDIWCTIKPMSIKFRNKYRIPSARLSTWDYGNDGSYFITICTARRKHYFGEIINAEMQLSKIGELANKIWNAIPDHFPHFYLDAFTVMPNHLHGIILIKKPYPNRGLIAHPPKPNHPRFRNQGKKTISSMVGSFKSAVAKYCNENNLPFGWQARFHDHIIRNDEELYVIRNYIINNPRNWKEDKFYSKW
jgi:putative transposase